MRVANRCTRRWWAVTVPALIATAPLIGMSFHGDERPRIYSVARRFGSNPIEAVRGTYRDIDLFLDMGNFRPVGRFLETVEHGFILDAGEATGLAPHVVHGVIRLLMVMLLAHVATLVVSALARSAGAAPNHPALVLYPLALGTVLVANGSHGPDAIDRWYIHITLINFPHTLIGVVVVILAIALAVARDRDMQIRPLKWHEPVTMALLGAVAAVIYDLVYLAPVVAAAFIAARAAAAGLPVRSVLASAAVRRWTALSIGFVVVFVPIRIEIARRCARQSCYIASDVSPSADAFDHAASRLFAGTPPAGWFHNAGLSRHFGLELGFVDLAANSLMGLLLAAIAAATAAAAVRATGTAGGADSPAAAPHPTGGTDSPAAAPHPTGGTDSPAAAPHREASKAEEQTRWRRLAVALGVFGAATAALSAMLASLSRRVQQIELRFADAWRETLLTQVAWSFVIAGCVAALVGLIRARGATKIAAGLLGACLTLTLLANWRLAQTDRHLPLSSITSQISTATVNLDATENGNAHRCSLIDAYSELVPGHLNMGGPALREHLDLLMLDRYGWPFCDPAPIGADAR